MKPTIKRGLTVVGLLTFWCASMPTTWAAIVGSSVTGMSIAQQRSAFPNMSNDENKAAAAKAEGKDVGDIFAGKEQDMDVAIRKTGSTAVEDAIPYLVNLAKTGNWNEVQQELNKVPEAGERTKVAGLLINAASAEAQRGVQIQVPGWLPKMAGMGGISTSEAERIASELKDDLLATLQRKGDVQAVADKIDEAGKDPAVRDALDNITSDILTAVAPYLQVRAMILPYNTPPRSSIVDLANAFASEEGKIIIVTGVTSGKTAKEVMGELGLAKEPEIRAEEIITAESGLPSNIKFGEVLAMVDDQFKKGALAAAGYPNVTVFSANPGKISYTELINLIRKNV